MSVGDTRGDGIPLDFPADPGMIGTRQKFNRWARLKGISQQAADWRVFRTDQIKRAFPHVSPFHIKNQVWSECAHVFGFKDDFVAEPTTPDQLGSVKPAVIVKEVPEKPQELTESEIKILMDAESGTPETFRRDLIWAYDHIPDTRVNADNCPSTGAYGILIWGRKYKDKFYALYAKQMQDDQKASTGDIIGDDGRRNMKLIDRLLFAQEQEYV